jgi:DNA-binding NtrC family response regulator/tetratricopeptide (TPR) repeat protein
MFISTDRQEAVERDEAARPVRDPGAKLKQALDLLRIYLGGHAYQAAESLLEDLRSTLVDPAVPFEAAAEVRRYEAECLLERGRASEALALCESQLARESLLPDDLRLAFWTLAARALFLRGEYGRVLDVCERMIDSVTRLGQFAWLGEMETLSGLARQRVREFSRARQHFENALFAFQRIGSTPGMIRTMIHLGILLKNDTRWDMALDHLRRAQRLAEELGDVVRVAQTGVNIGIVAFKSGRWEVAETALDRALAAYRAVGRPQGITCAAIARASLHRVRGEFDMARSLYREALLLSRRHGFQREIVLCYEFLGELEHDRGHPHRALRLYQKALEIAMRIAPQGDLISEIERRIAESLTALGEIEPAAESARRGLAVALSIGDRFEEAAIHRALGAVFAAKGDAVSALEHLERSAAAFRAMDAPHELSKTLVILGDVWSLSDEEPAPERAREAFWEARHLLRRLGLSLERADVRLEALQRGGLAPASPARRPRPAPTSDRDFSRFGFLTRDPGLLGALGELESFAQTRLPVLVIGESGVGKELVAQAVHEMSDRRHRRFVPVNCGTLPAGMQESELFGHVRGAFTGADRDRLGLFEAADGGTIFLDEVGEMTHRAQVKLLRVLESGEIRRLGEAFFRRVDVRVVSATNADLAAALRQKKFREDLYYRLNGVMIEIPPLRDRLGDVPLIAQFLVERFSREMGKAVKVSPLVNAALRSYRWPGNVRELRHQIERAMALVADGGVVLPDHLSLPCSGPISSESATLAERVLAEERRLILEALERSGWNRTRAARCLGNMSRTTLVGKMKKLGVVRPAAARI